MQYFPYLNDLDFWSGIKDGLESVMYLYQALFVLINSLFALVSLLISFRLFQLTLKTVNQIERQTSLLKTQIESTNEAKLMIGDLYFLVSIRYEFYGYLKEDNFFYSNEGKDYSFPFLNVYNIGHGSSYNINVIFNLNIDEVIIKLNKSIESFGLIHEMSIERVSNFIFFSRIEEGCKSSLFSTHIESDLLVNKSFIFPSNRVNDLDSVTFPSNIDFILRTWSYFTLFLLNVKKMDDLFLDQNYFKNLQFDIDIFYYNTTRTYVKSTHTLNINFVPPLSSDPIENTTFKLYIDSIFKSEEYV